MSVKVFETLHVYQDGKLVFTCQNDTAALQYGLSELINLNNIVVKRVVETHSYLMGSGFPDNQLPNPFKHHRVVVTPNDHPHYSLKE